MAHARGGVRDQPHAGLGLVRATPRGDEVGGCNEGHLVVIIGVMDGVLWRLIWLVWIVDGLHGPWAVCSIAGCVGIPWCIPVPWDVFVLGTCGALVKCILRSLWGALVTVTSSSSSSRCSRRC